MNYETVTPKNFTERAKLIGITIEPKVVNGSVEGLKLTDSAGNTLLVEKRDYSVSVLVQTKPKVKKFRAYGTLPALGEVDKVFDKEDDAIRARDELEKAGATHVDWEHCEVEVSE